MTRIAIFTDTDLSLNTEAARALKAVLLHTPSDLHPRIVTAADLPTDTEDYFAASSLGLRLPWNWQQRVFWPRVGAFARQLRAGGAQVVHCNTTGPVGLAGFWLARRAGVPVTASVHEPIGPSPRTSGLPSRMAAVGERVTRWAFETSVAILTPSHAATAALAARGFTRLHTWPRGVDGSRFAPHRASSALREAWHVDHRRPAILVPLAPLTKSEVEMIEPIRRCLHRHAIAHQFVFAGVTRTGVDLRRVCPDGVFIERGSDDELAVVLASSDLCLFLGATDIAGGTVLEAQASGVPAIVSDAGGAREQVLAGDSAYLYRAGDVEDVVSALAVSLRDAGRRAAMGRVARAQALERGWPASLGPLHQAWRAAIRGRVAHAAGDRSVSSNEAA